jgi:D-alanine-D-alanine ligase
MQNSDTQLNYSSNTGSHVNLIPQTDELLNFIKQNPLFEKIAVLMGGHSQERDISFMSGNGVLNALKKHGLNAYAIDPKVDDIFSLKAKGFSACIISLHGRYGEDGVIQSILESIQLPYTGSGVMSSALAMHKEMTKRIWQTYDLPTPKFIALDAEKTDQLDSQIYKKIEDQFNFPLIVKPTCEGSSIGLTKVLTKEELQAAYDKAKKIDRFVLIEEFIEGKELTCAVFQDKTGHYALPLIEIKAPDANYDYQNKYFSDDVKYECPAAIAPDLAQKIQALCVSAFEAVNAKTWARVDVMLKNNQPYLLEINTSPGMTSHSLVPMAANALGCDYENLVLYLLTQVSLNKLS